MESVDAHCYELCLDLELCSTLLTDETVMHQMPIASITQSQVSSVRVSFLLEVEAFNTATLNSFLVEM